jgi:thioredoxin-related protein
MKQRTITILLGLLFLVNLTSSAQKLYDPSLNAKDQITSAVDKAKKEGKQVLIQIGGNWCPWCIKMHNYLHSEPELTKLLEDDFVFIEVNYSKENKNLDVLEDLGFPQRFGFPVMVVVNDKGERIHTQSTGYLENGNTYDFEKVKSFLYNWRSDALNPEYYK